ncbi:MAG: hypothetical protein Q8S73_41960 [Deltaproteobacteria bacterium]|nr:hypothetical protein [Myxococcales bacterium]MDP3220727.1 hypothetical protein [Deltaproteobacteria bacterium]
MEGCALAEGFWTAAIPLVLAPSLWLALRRGRRAKAGHRAQPALSVALCVPLAAAIWGYVGVLHVVRAPGTERVVAVEQAGVIVQPKVPGVTMIDIARGMLRLTAPRGSMGRCAESRVPFATMGERRLRRFEATLWREDRCGELTRLLFYTGQRDAAEGVGRTCHDPEACSIAASISESRLDSGRRYGGVSGQGPGLPCEVDLSRPANASHAPGRTAYP